MRWVFVRPQYISFYYDPEIQEPLGLEYLAASRRQRHDAVLILDSILDALDDLTLAKRAVSFKPDVIGFSLTTAPETASVNEIYRNVNRLLPGNRIRWLAGGNFVSTEPEAAAKLLPVCFLLVRYEGENALDELSKGWRTETVAEKESHDPSASRVYITPTTVDPDQLPFPERRYADRILASGWAFNIQGSRGCCGACRFCASPGMGVKTNRWRGRSIPNIIDEIQVLYRKYGAVSFNFIDEDFLGPPAAAETRAIRFAEELRARQLRISFGIQVRPASLSEKAVKALTGAGLTYVFMGLESDDPEDFEYWNRPWTDDPWRYVDLIRANGAEINTGVMLFHPRCTLPGIRRFAEKLRRYRLLEYRSAINQLDAMPGSVFYREARDRGEISEDAVGPQLLPFRHSGPERFHRDLLPALAPLGPVSMHAVCAIPPFMARRFLEPGLDPLYRALKAVLEILDNQVADTFFTLLDYHEKRSPFPGGIKELRRKNLAVAVRGAAALVKHGFADRIETLRDAIRMDSGL